MLALRNVGARVGTLPVVISRSVTSVLSPLEKKYYPQIGNREIVGYGRGGAPVYYDDLMCPYPAIRFRNHDEKIAALRKKEEGPWNQLTLEEVKTLYRHSFCRTLEETSSTTGMWKMGFAWGFIVLTVGSCFFIYLKLALGQLPNNVMSLPEYKEAMRYKRVMGRTGSIHELYDFDVASRRFRE